MFRIASAALLPCFCLATLAMTGAAKAQTLTTATSVEASSPEIIFGNPVTLSAFVSPNDVGLSGTVTFFDNGNPIPGVSAVPLSNGVAVATTNFLFAGLDLITADYSGSPGFSASSGSFDEVVVMANTELSLSASANSVNSNGQLLLTANVTPLGTPAQPIGDVSFFDGSAFLGTELLNPDGVATFLLFADDLAIGPQTLTAAYDGDANFLRSSGSQTVTVTPAPVPVPEPATWSLMLAGFGITGLMLRRKEVSERWRRVSASRP